MLPLAHQCYRTLRCLSRGGRMAHWIAGTFITCGLLTVMYTVTILESGQDNLPESVWKLRDIDSGAKLAKGGSAEFHKNIIGKYKKDTDAHHEKMSDTHIKEYLTFDDKQNIKINLKQDSITNGRYKQVILDQMAQNKKEVRMNKNFRRVEEEMLQRAKLVRRICHKYGLGEGESGKKRQLQYPPTANYDVLYIDRPDALTYCPVYKAASTSWLYMLSILAGASEAQLQNSKQQISTIARSLYPELSYDEAEQAVMHTTKFMIVRHPFERIVSAYRDKLENINIGQKDGVQYFYEKYGKKIVSKYRKSNNGTRRFKLPHLDDRPDIPPPEGIEPTFDEFVQYLIDTDLVQHSDDHWMPYYLFCTPCYINYDVIAKFETLERDQMYILKKLGLEQKIAPKWKHLTKGKKTADIARKYMKSISRDKILKLAKKYEVDFEMYGYTMGNFVN